MIFGVLLILVGLVIAAAATMGSGTDFHLFAALNVIGLGAICCTIAHYLKAVLELLREQKAPAPKIAPATREKPAARDQSEWDNALLAARGRKF